MVGKSSKSGKNKFGKSKLKRQRDKIVTSIDSFDHL